MSFRQPGGGSCVSELTSTLMTCLRRQVGVSVQPVSAGVNVADQTLSWTGGCEAPVVPLAAEDPSVVPASQQLSADERMRALAQLQRIVSAVAAEHPALGVIKEPLSSVKDASLSPVCSASQMPEEGVGSAIKKRPRDRSHDEDPVEEERVAVWNQVTGKKLTGQAAPKRKCVPHAQHRDECPPNR